MLYSYSPKGEKSALVADSLEDLSSQLAETGHNTDFSPLGE